MMPSSRAAPQDCFVQQMAGGSLVPAGTIGVAIAPDGTVSRVASGQRLPRQVAKAFCVWPGPFACYVQLHPAAPEVQLKLRFVLDSPDPRIPMQRFDLMLASEIAQDLSQADMAARISQGLQQQLASGELDCFACMSVAEWMRFRSQLERWLYTRFGLTVEDCALEDVGDRVDYAQILLQRVQVELALAEPALLEPVLAEPALLEPVLAEPVLAAVASTAGVQTRADGEPAPPLASESLPIPAPQRPSSSPRKQALRHFSSLVDQDASLLRRLFLEWPELTRRWRALDPPAGMFACQQTTLQRLDLLKTRVNTMPALQLAGPAQALAPALMAARHAHTRQALQTWDQAWAMLARLGSGETGQWQKDQIECLIANLEYSLGQRAAVPEADS